MADEVGEQDRDEPTLDPHPGSGHLARGCRVSPERVAAVPAEALPRLVRGIACCAQDRE